MLHIPVLPRHMHAFTDCLSYIYIVSKLGVLFHNALFRNLNVDFVSAS